MGIANAAPCASLTGTTVYLQVGDTQTSLMKRLARVLHGTTSA